MPDQYAVAASPYVICHCLPGVRSLVITRTALSAQWLERALDEVRALRRQYPEWLYWLEANPDHA